MDNSSKGIIAATVLGFGALAFYSAFLHPSYELGRGYRDKAVVHEHKVIPRRMDNRGPAGGDIIPEQYHIIFKFKDGELCTFKGKEKKVYETFKVGDKVIIDYRLLQNTKDENDVKGCLVSRIKKEQS